mmetsp:Transcript_23449/g.75810  ORF Transcript_23449/g.75810 Transcript_23449/m.75810 type:complete len:250 (-) Transcript_23449:147-896(-)
MQHGSLDWSGSYVPQHPTEDRMVDAQVQIPIVCMDVLHRLQKSVGMLLHGRARKSPLAALFAPASYPSPHEVLGRIIGTRVAAVAIHLAGEAIAEVDCADKLREQHGRAVGGGAPQGRRHVEAQHRVLAHGHDPHAGPPPRGRRGGVPAAVAQRIAGLVAPRELDGAAAGGVSRRRRGLDAIAVARQIRQPLRHLVQGRSQPAAPAPERGREGVAPAEGQARAPGHGGAQEQMRKLSGDRDILRLAARP